MGCKIKTAIVLAILGGVSALAGAQVQFPVNLPTPKVGEVTKYRTVDLWNNKELSTSQIELVEIQNDRLVTRLTSSVDPSPSTRTFTSEWQPCRSMRNSDQLVCAGALKFPMQLGGKHSYDKLPWPSGNGHSSGACEVKAEEKVTVPAGTFDAVRLECSGFWNRIFDGTFGGKQTELFWYAPAIARIVKSQFFDFTSSGAANTKSQTEMTQFTAAK